MLKALRSILYKSRMYRPGDQLPAEDKDLVERWIRYGSAVWTEGASSDPPPRAELVTKEPGELGKAQPSSGEDLAGKIPAGRSRKRKS